MSLIFGPVIGRCPSIGIKSQRPRLEKNKYVILFGVLSYIVPDRKAIYTPFQSVTNFYLMKKFSFRVF